ncbi:unnamed protein product, partial [Staurois parvus]
MMMRLIALGSPRRHQAIASASSGEEGGSLAASKTVGGLPRRQQGRSSVSGGKRPRSTAPAPLQPTTTASSGAGVHGGSSSQPVRSIDRGGQSFLLSAVWQFFVKPPEEVNVAVCRLCGPESQAWPGGPCWDYSVAAAYAASPYWWPGKTVIKIRRFCPPQPPAPSPAPLLAPSPDVNRPLYQPVKAPTPLLRGVVARWHLPLVQMLLLLLLLLFTDSVSSLSWNPFPRDNSLRARTRR